MLPAFGGLLLLAPTATPDLAQPSLESWFLPAHVERQLETGRALGSLLSTSAAEARRQAFEELGTNRGGASGGSRELLARTFEQRGLLVEPAAVGEAANDASQALTAVLAGARLPGLEVVVGCRAGARSGDCTVVLAELARAFGELARRGSRPARSVRLALWPEAGAGSWVDARADDVRESGVAYVDVGALSPGARVVISATPSLAALAAAVGAAPAPDGEPAVATGHRSLDLAADGDAAAFVRAGLPTAVVAGAVESVGHDSPGEPAVMLATAARTTAALAATIAAADVLPFDPAGYPATVAAGLADRQGGDASPLGQRAAEVRRWAEATMREVAEAVAGGRLGVETADAVSWELAQLERLWLSPPASGGAAEHLLLPAGASGAALPLLQRAWLAGDPSAVRRGEERYASLLGLLVERLRVIRRLAAAPATAPLESEELEVPAVPLPDAGHDGRGGAR